MIKEYNMWFTRIFSPQSFFNYSLYRFMRKLFSFIKYDFAELLIIVACAALFILIWEYFFWYGGLTMVEYGPFIEYCCELFLCSGCFGNVFWSGVAPVWLLAVNIYPVVFRFRNWTKKFGFRGYDLYVRSRQEKIPPRICINSFGGYWCVII